MATKIKTRYRKSSGFVYNKPYYVLTAIFRSDRFKVYENKLNDTFNKIGFIPPSKQQHKKAVVYDLNTLIDNLKAKEVDIVKAAQEVLKDFGLNEQPEGDYNNYLMAIVDKLLFNKLPEYKPINYPEYKYDREDNPAELWIRIHTWTTKEIYKSYFPVVSALKGKLLNSVRKAKHWETFDRDLELYTLYLHVKANIKKGDIKKEISDVRGYKISVSTSAYEQMQLYPEYRGIKQKYHTQDFEDSNLARIVTATKAKLGNIQLL